ncbi:MAG TPA: XVIPCD domain-containing protein [Lysobacter sp.]|nr:XVIPCD domain-containing protein [Lysobacter sp.]
MSASSEKLAALSVASYTEFTESDKSDGIEIAGERYKIRAQVSAESGYQGVIFQRLDSGEMIVAHRGTEFGREAFKDGLVTDGGMVLLGVNTQERDALALTRLAIDMANRDNLATCQVPYITVTGHSLGGTLAQITAHRLGLRAETFNAYGAAGLTADYPRVDPDIVNHVRATDVVGAASAHIGEVRLYATPDDIAALEKHGYDNGRHVVDLRNPFGVAFGIGLGAHYADNFVAENARGQSILNEADAMRAQDNAEMIRDYRNDIRRLHGGLALPRNLVDGVVDLGARIAGRPARDPAPASAFDAGACTVPASPDLLEQSRRGVFALDARLGRAPDADSERLIAGVFRGAREAGLSRIDDVVLSTATPTAPAGASVFAVQGALDDPLRLIARIDVREALRTPADASLRAAEAMPVVADLPQLPMQEPPRVMSMSR